MNLLTDISDDATNDNLLSSCLLDRSSEVSVIPCIDLALALDQWSIWIHLQNLLWEGAIRS